MVNCIPSSQNIISGLLSIATIQLTIMYLKQLSVLSVSLFFVAIAATAHYIFFKHLLLGLIHEDDGAAAIVLNNLKADLGNIRNEVIRMIADMSGDQTCKDSYRGRPCARIATLDVPETVEGKTVCVHCISCAEYLILE